MPLNTRPFRPLLSTSLLPVLIAAVVAASARPAHAGLRVITTVETLADLARRVGGDRVEVEALCRGYNDPHTIEPKPSLVLKLSRADLLVVVGLDLEIGWLPTLLTGSRNRRILPGNPGYLDASATISVLDVPTTAVDRSMGDIHPRGNPHYWIPPDNALRIAAEIAGRLRQLDPAGSAAYDAGLRALAAELGRRRPGWEARASKLRGTQIVTYHKSWSYVSAWLGLREVGYVEPKPGVPSPPQHVATLIELMRRGQVRLLLEESFYGRNLTQLIARQAGARLCIVPNDVGATPQIRSYFDLVDAVLAELLRY